MDDPPPTSSSSPLSAMIESSQIIQSSSLLVNSSTSYESIMKRLLKIIRNHRVVNDLKPLVDLWELCNAPPTPPPQSQSQFRVQPSQDSFDTLPKPLKRDSSKLPLHTPTTVENREKESKKPRLSANTSNNSSVNKFTSICDSPPIKTENEIFNSIANKASQINEQKTQISLQEHSQSMSSIKYDSNSSVPIDSINNEFSDFTNSMVVDMLDFSCYICK